jgi:hypothetical protein
MDRVAVEVDLAVAGAEIAGDDFHERRLARAVVAHQADHLAGEDLHVDVVERADRAEFLADPCQFQNRLPGCSCGFHARPFAQTYRLTSDSRYS